MHIPKIRAPQVAWLALLLLAVVVAACGGAAAPAEEEPAAEEEAAPAEEEPMEEEAPAEEEAMEEAEEFFPDAGAAIEEPLAPDGPATDGDVVDAETQLAESASQSLRLVIKDGFITLHVADIDTALGQITAIAGQHGGYVLSSESTQYNVYKSADITITVRAEDFDTAMTELRAIAIDVLDERVEGQDVSTEFVDLESRLRNLEATAERLRGFLDDAKTVEEALEINEELAVIEAEIEEVRGRMNYLQTRAALSTITVSLTTDPDPTPTPTVTPTPTSTPTPTPTSTPTATPTPTLTPTPTPWSPVETLQDATHIERNILRLMVQRVTDTLIFVAVVVVPTLLPFVGLFFVGRAAYRRWWPSLTVRRPKEKPEESDEG